MRSFKLNLFAFFTVTLLFGSLQLYAQQGTEEQQQSKKMIIIKKYIDKDGIETIERIVKESDDFDINQLEGMDENFDIDIEEIEDQIRINIQQTDENGNPQIFKWDGKGDMPDEIRNELKEKGMSFNFSNEGDGEFKHHFKSCKPKQPKAFLGVVADEDPNGLMLDEIVAGSAAEAAGLREGDVLTSIDGEAVNSVHQLKVVLRNFQPGDDIALNYNRDGQKLQTTTTLKSKQQGRNFNRNYNRNFNRNYNYNRFQNDRPSPCKPFVGVYLGTGYNQDGVGVTEVIDNTPAHKAGLITGDIITAIDDVKVTTHRGITQQRDTHKAGDQFTITFLRDGNTRMVNAQFPACDDKSEIQPKQDKLIIIKKKKETALLDQVSNPDSKLNISPSNKQTNLSDNTLRLDEMRTFPNPTANKVNVQFKGEAVATTLRITDIMGRELLRQELVDFDGFYNEEINLKDIASPGTLLLHITQGNQIHTEKIILSTPF